jgi:hypothetical protein
MPHRAFRRGQRDHVSRLTEHDHRHDAICFSDEIVIDFPSMARAVDRMRRSFLIDERLADRPTSLPLSRRQARDGTVVPVEVPVRFMCGRCDGRGETAGTACRPCGGTGTEVSRRGMRVSVPPGVSHGDRFHVLVPSPNDAPFRIELQISVQ